MDAGKQRSYSDDLRIGDAWLPMDFPDIGYAEICARHQIMEVNIGEEPFPGIAALTLRPGIRNLAREMYTKMHSKWNTRKRIADLWALRKRRWLREAAFAFFRVHRLGQLPVSVPKDVVRLIVVHIKRGG